jgi:hypothetical protein
MKDLMRAAWAGDVKIKYARAGRWSVFLRYISRYNKCGLAIWLKIFEVIHRLWRDLRGAKDTTCSRSSVGSFCSIESDMIEMTNPEMITKAL